MDYSQNREEHPSLGPVDSQGDTAVDTFNFVIYGATSAGLT